MADEALVLQQRLLDKLEEWRNSTEFGVSKYDNQKYKRAKGMLQATHPKVLTEILGITSVPNAGRDAMNLIRGMDLKTLSNLEIFRGLGDKVVGHHMSAFGAISGALENQSPERRLELLNRAIDEGFITGMDPKGIGPIRTSIHKPIAHQGDYSGKKPGYKVDTFSNTDDIEDIWTSLKASLQQQQGSFFDARNHQSTQDLVSASKGVFGSDLITELDLPIDIRAEASKAADPIASKMNNIINEFSGNDAQIQNNARRLLETLPDKQINAISKLSLRRQALQGLSNIPKVPKWARVGGVLTAAGVIGDASQAAEGGVGVATKTGKEQTAAGLNLASGVLGLASLAAPPLTAAAAVVGGVGMLADNRIERDKRRERDTDIKAGRIQPSRPDPYSTTITAPKPTTLDKIIQNPGNEAKFALGKLRDFVLGFDN